MTLKILLFVAMGGAVGAVGRYSATLAITQWTGGGFPYGTMFVNILGSLLLGFLLAAISLNWSPSPEMRSFLQVGVLGAFTTFSTFSMDAYDQMTKGQYMEMAMYVGGSVIVGILAMVMGVTIGRQLFA